MDDVRRIYDLVFFLFLLSSLALMIDVCFTTNVKAHYRNHARNSLLISATFALLALLMIPFFPFIWAQVFHPLLFDNQFWKTNPNDVSWYLMPKTFFLRVIIFITLVTLLLNLLLWYLCRATQTNTRPPTSN